jgi:N-methylhydantoinase A
MVNERHVGGTVLRLPSLDIQTISAGGGSIARSTWAAPFASGRSRPARSGPRVLWPRRHAPTLTDAAVAIGMLAPDEYLGGAMQLNVELARAAIDEHVARPLGLAIHEAAYAMVAIANSHMALARAQPVGRARLRRAPFSLLSFGGAGPLFAPFLARDLEMREIIVPTRPGVFSASGLLLSDVRYAYQAPMLSPIEAADAGTVRTRFAQLAR